VEGSFWEASHTNTDPNRLRRVAQSFTESCRFSSFLCCWHSRSFNWRSHKSVFFFYHISPFFVSIYLQTPSLSTSLTTGVSLDPNRNTVLFTEVVFHTTHLFNCTHYSSRLLSSLSLLPQHQRKTSQTATAQSLVTTIPPLSMAPFLATARSVIRQRLKMLPLPQPRATSPQHPQTSMVAEMDQMVRHRVLGLQDLEVYMGRVMGTFQVQRDSGPCSEC
jgi:hypothetical protein